MTLPLCERCHGIIHQQDMRLAVLREQGKRRRAMSGKKVTGWTPYGWDAGQDGTLSENVVEQGWLGYMRDRRASGATLHLIAAELNVKNVRTKKDKSWDHSTVKKILDRGCIPSIYLMRAA